MMRCVSRVNQKLLDQYLSSFSDRHSHILQMEDASVPARSAQLTLPANCLKLSFRFITSHTYQVIKVRLVGESTPDLYSVIEIHDFGYMIQILSRYLLNKKITFSLINSSIESITYIWRLRFTICILFTQLLIL